VSMTVWVVAPLAGVHGITVPPDGTGGELLCQFGKVSAASWPGGTPARVSHFAGSGCSAGLTR
jgi:hypothetical protein